MMNKLLKKLLFLALSLSPSFVIAANNGANNISYNSNYTNVSGSCNSNEISTVFGCVGKGEQSLPTFIGKAFSWFAGIIGALAVLGLVWAAYMYVTSGGNPDSISKAKDIIWTSVASLVIVIFSWAFFKLLGVV